MSQRLLDPRPPAASLDNVRLALLLAGLAIAFFIAMIADHLSW
jgi:hypothetical protein